MPGFFEGISLWSGAAVCSLGRLILFHQTTLLFHVKIWGSALCDTRSNSIGATGNETVSCTPGSWAKAYSTLQICEHHPSLWNWRVKTVKQFIQFMFLPFENSGLAMQVVLGQKLERLMHPCAWHSEVLAVLFCWGQESHNIEMGEPRKFIQNWNQNRMSILYILVHMVYIWYTYGIHNLYDSYDINSTRSIPTIPTIPTYDTYIHRYVFTSKHTHVHTYLLTYLPTYLYTAYLHTYISQCLHTYVSTYRDTQTPTYLPTYIHTHTHTTI